MNRRDFVKLFSATIASTGAAKLLAVEPLTAPKVDMITPKRLLIIGGDLHIPTSHMISVDIRYDGNYQGLLPGQPIKTVDAEFYAHNEGGEIATDKDIETIDAIGMDRCVKFGLPQLDGERYLVTSYEIKARVDELITASITAVKIA